MSLYNSVVGVDPLAPYILGQLGITDTKTIPRMRDAYVDRDRKTLVIFTRTGGGNRENYVEENDRLRKIVGFVDDHDDSFDPTFAHFHYEPQTDQAKQLVSLTLEAKEEGHTELLRPMERFQLAVGQMAKS